MQQAKIDNSKALGADIRHARKQQKFTQEELADLAGVGPRFISDIENGKDTAQLGKALLVLAALGIGLYALSKWR